MICSVALLAGYQRSRFVRWTNHPPLTVDELGEASLVLRIERADGERLCSSGLHVRDIPDRPFGLTRR